MLKINFKNLLHSKSDFASSWDQKFLPGYIINLAINIKINYEIIFTGIIFTNLEKSS